MNGESDAEIGSMPVSDGFLAHLRAIGVNNIQNSDLFHCIRLRCDFRKVVCIVRRTQLRLIGHGRLAPAYPECYECAQGCIIEREVIRKARKSLCKSGGYVRLKFPL
jgi:hypothetical protein